MPLAGGVMATTEAVVGVAAVVAAAAVAMGG